MKIVADDEFNDCATALALALAFTRSDLLSSSLRSFLRSESEGFKFVVCREDAGRDQFSREAFSILSKYSSQIDPPARETERSINIGV